MLIFHIVVCLCPLENALDSFGIWIINTSNKILGASWNVNTIQLFQFLFKFLVIHIEVNWYNASSSTLQELNMRCLDELFCWEWINNIIGKQCLILSFFKYFILNSEKFFVPGSFGSCWLCENTNYWVLNLLSSMMSCTNHW